MNRSSLNGASHKRSKRLTLVIQCEARWPECPSGLWQDKQGQFYLGNSARSAKPVTLLEALRWYPRMDQLAIRDELSTAGDTVPLCIAAADAIERLQGGAK